MKTKDEIVYDWFFRYTGLEPDECGKFVLLTNFGKYLEIFSELTNEPILGLNKNMPSVTHNDITLINFGMGSPNAAIIMDLLSSVKPRAVLFLGKCGGLKKKNQIGDLIIPLAAIRGEGTSNDYLPPEVPALPAFSLQRAISSTIRDWGNYDVSTSPSDRTYFPKLFGIGKPSCR
ncbi:MAG: hypothetical protein ACPGLV_16345, partial [Bacteroidia bacterium]